MKKNPYLRPWQNVGGEPRALAPGGWDLEAGRGGGRSPGHGAELADGALRQLGGEACAWGREGIFKPLNLFGTALHNCLGFNIMLCKLC